MVTLQREAQRKRAKRRKIGETQYPTKAAHTSWTFLKQMNG